ncbi:hypothetical protein [Bartonella heixiaziensis]|uniref:hypothetical protein n=1 Tax=Bartonella heixiaziensis TaxID=1461000 RepID=UPI003D1DA6AF
MRTGCCGEDVAERGAYGTLSSGVIVDFQGALRFFRIVSVREAVFCFFLEFPLAERNSGGVVPPADCS